MNPTDDQLDQLFAAAQARALPTAGPVPYGLETRVLAAWREHRVVPGAWGDASVLVRGLLLASIIMVMSVWPTLTTTTDPYAEQVQLADATIQPDATAP